METRVKSLVGILGVSLGSSLLICILKLSYGEGSGSLAFIADGVHSLFDAAATLVGIVSIILASRPPDASHPYGHRKFEAVSAVMLAMLLFLASYEIGTVAVQKIKNPGAMPYFGWAGVAIIVFAMANSLVLSVLEKKRAKPLTSAYLASDALHNQSDFLTAAAVLVSLVCSRFRIPYVDAGATIVITLYLFYFSVNLALFNLRPLVDHSVLNPREVRAIAASIVGVLDCHHIRSRGETDHHFLDLNLHLPGDITLERAHEITHEVETRLKSAFPGLIDVVIHTEPHGHAPCSKEGQGF